MAFQPVDCPKDCIYRGAEYSHGKAGCNYLALTGELRGCEPGMGCTRYVVTQRPTPRSINCDIAVSQSSRNRRKPAWNTVLGYQMWQDGKSYSQIAEAVGVSRHTVVERAHRCWKHGRL